MGIAITNQMIEVSYDNAKKVYHKQIELGKALDAIVATTGMGRGSALAYVHDFSQMMQGNEYHRTMNTRATEYFLLNILNDYGKEYFVNALQAAKAHTEYYAKQGKGSLRAIEELVQRLF
ncbi:hypothetical protein [Paenibacillus sp. FSL E2-0190]|uniref:hypothetical protein n=1 Tax=Paenibacillus sp. FSL E2-0190 TaxID=2954504 RepID=UPI0030EF52DE